MLADVTADVPAAHGGRQQTALDAGLSASCVGRRTPDPDHLPADSAFLHEPGGSNPVRDGLSLAVDSEIPARIS